MAEEDIDFSHFEEGVTYVDSGLLSKLKEAMVDAYMLRAIPHMTGGSCDEGRFRYQTPRPSSRHQSETYYVSYPGGTWTRDTGLLGDDDGAVAYIPFDADANVYQPIANIVDGLIPLMNAPRPDAFTDQIAVMQHVMHHLSVTGNVRVSGEGSETTIDVGNTLVPRYIKEIHNELGDLDGRAMIRLREIYGGDRIGEVMTGLHAIAVVAGVLVAGEQQVWARFHRDFYKLVDAAADDFHAFSKGNEVTGGEVFDIVMSIADASGVLSVPKGVASAIGKAKTLAGVVDGFLPAAPAPHDYSLDGSSFDALNNSFETAIEDLVKDVDATESAFSECAASAIEATTGKNDDIVTTSFDLKYPEDFLNAGSDGIYKDVNGNPVSIQVTDNALQRIAGRYEAIGDHCNDVAKKLSGGPDQATWFRQFSTAGDFDGHFQAYANVVNLLITLLANNGAEMHEVGAKCLLILADFHDTDSVTKKQLKDIEKQLDAETRAVVKQTKIDVKSG